MMMINPDMRTFTAETKTIAVLVLDGFSFLSLGSIVEPFSILSHEFPRLDVRMRLVGFEQRIVRSRSDGEIRCAEVAEDLLVKSRHSLTPAAIILCSGPTVSPDQVQGLRRFLHQIRVAGAQVYGVGGVVWYMAEAGLLNDSEATIHWSSMAPFAEFFPDIGVNNALFVKNSRGGTCAGELATLDLAMDIVGQISEDSVSTVCNQLLVSHVREGQRRQPGSQVERLQNLPKVIRRAVELMVENIESILPASEIACLCGVSIRQLERMFNKYLNTSPMQYYMSLRIERAHELLLQTNLSLQEVALATGFSNCANLSKRYRQIHGVTPSKARARLQRRSGAVDPCFAPEFQEVQVSL